MVERARREFSIGDLRCYRAPIESFVEWFHDIEVGKVLLVCVWVWVCVAERGPTPTYPDTHMYAVSILECEYIVGDLGTNGHRANK